MIKINRNSQATPRSLITPDNSTDKQRHKAKLYYETVPSPKIAYKFDKYKEPDVVRTLELLFNKKCAYCESNYSAVSVMDVEHYRPKGGVNECPGHKGYWWLALDWDNLLPSCIDCNRSRGQKKVVLNPDGTVYVTLKNENSGKENSFPVDGGYFAMQESDDHHLEKPLIINPCQMEPDKHLEWYTTILNLPIICAKSNLGLKDSKGENTIKILGLNRWGLVNERGEVLQQLAVIVVDIHELIEIALEIPAGERRRKIMKKIDDKIDYLMSLGLPDKKYSAMSNSYINTELANIKEKLRGFKL
ncbi:hypothetical protein PZA20_01745 [Pectobacterium polaris]|uniref:hypothetical protein n=1 Tax=Pectobacterium polaris TaxID=2042057 RepID=UPI0023AF20C2|nr:hypothetical protein [Pectobacterium polaris]MDE8740550.1 hypothetical protein [Pectobacterium polaris]